MRNFILQHFKILDMANITYTNKGEILPLRLFLFNLNQFQPQHCSIIFQFQRCLIGLKTDRMGVDQMIKDREQRIKG